MNDVGLPFDSLFKQVVLACMLFPYEYFQKKWQPSLTGQLTPSHSKLRTQILFHTIPEAKQEPPILCSRKGTPLVDVELWNNTTLGFPAFTNKSSCGLKRPNFNCTHAKPGNVYFMNAFPYGRNNRTFQICRVSIHMLVFQTKITTCFWQKYTIFTLRCAIPPKKFNTRSADPLLYRDILFTSLDRLEIGRFTAEPPRHQRGRRACFRTTALYPAGLKPTQLHCKSW